MLAWLLPVLLAPFIGSFLGVIIRRLPAGRPVALARSCCESCGHTLSPIELIPVLSFVLQRGRCRACGAPIHPAHLWIELAALAVAAAAALVMSDPAELWLACGLGWTLLALAAIDWDHMRLPDTLTLPLLLAGLAATGWLDPDAAPDHAAAAALGFLAFRLLAWSYRALRGRDGLGGGDAKLLAAAGAWLGLDALPAIVVAAACLGLLVALAQRARGHALTAATAVPFGPGLCAALWLGWLYGHAT